jgi:hypothetical protein
VIWTLTEAQQSDCFSTKAWYAAFLLSKDLIFGPEVFRWPSANLSVPFSMREVVAFTPANALHRRASNA